MSERAPRTPQQEIAHASMEGNVYMPQNALGLTVSSAERVFLNENPKAMVAALVASIPEDEALELRTVKANAQHVSHNIDITLTPDDVRRTLIAGNISTLNFIAGALGMQKRIGYVGNVRRFTPEGNWANDKLIVRAQEVQNLFTDENVGALRTILSTVGTTLQDPEVKRKLKERKELYKGWKDKTEDEQKIAKDKIKQLSNDVIQTLTNTIFEKGEELDTKESKTAAMHLMREVGAFIENS